MFMAVAGGILVGVVGLAAAYDYVARRHGRDTGVPGSGPLNSQSMGVDRAANVAHERDFQH